MPDDLPEQLAQHLSQVEYPALPESWPRPTLPTLGHATAQSSPMNNSETAPLDWPETSRFHPPALPSVDLDNPVQPAPIQTLPELPTQRVPSVRTQHHATTTPASLPDWHTPGRVQTPALSDVSSGHATPPVPAVPSVFQPLARSLASPPLPDWPERKPFQPPELPKVPLVGLQAPALEPFHTPAPGHIPAPGTAGAGTSFTPPVLAEMNVLAGLPKMAREPIRRGDLFPEMRQPPLPNPRSDDIFAGGPLPPQALPGEHGGGESVTLLRQIAASLERLVNQPPAQAPGMPPGGGIQTGGVFGSLQTVPLGQMEGPQDPFSGAAPSMRWRR